LSKNFQRQSCNTINYLSNVINILAGDGRVPVKFGPKGTDTHYEACAFYHRSLGGVTRGAMSSRRYQTFLFLHAVKHEIRFHRAVSCGL